VSTPSDWQAQALALPLAAMGGALAHAVHMPLAWVLGAMLAGGFAFASVLRLRQRTRAMTSDERGRFVVHLRVDPAIADAASSLASQRAMNRLVDELQIMGVRQLSYL
jgi:hypothetical protein